MRRTSLVGGAVVPAESVAGWVAAAATVLALYAAVVLGGGVLVGRTDSPHLGLSVLATALVAWLAEPVRVRTERWAARRLSHDRGSPYDVLAQFSQQVAAGVSGEQAPAVIARMLVQGTGVAWAQVWVLVAGQLRLVATYPPDAAADAAPPSLYESTPLPGMRTVTVMRAGMTLGVLRVGERDGRPMTAVEDRLLAGLASQAGMVLETARLRAELSDRARELAVRAEELRQARTALVTAQDLERRRLERDIHDGAQQQLVALAINLKVAKAMATTDPVHARTILGEQLAAASEAIGALSDLTRGLLPEVLASRGLGPAVAHSTTGNPVPVVVTADALPRLAPDIEATLYFCALEAVQNATKHARATRIHVRSESVGDRVSLRIEDDGTGFEDGSVGGTGLANMRERVASLDGALRLGNTRSGGTAVVVDVPVRGHDAPPRTGPVE